jgi:hypothetical protein
VPDEAPADAQQWEEDWDDDSIGDDFAKALRAELAKPAEQQQQGMES